MRDVRVFKTADDLHDGVHFADVAEEFVSQPFPLRCAFHQSGNVHELDGCRDDFVRFGDFGQRSQTRIRHFDDADIGINGAKRIILRSRLARARDSVEQRGLADIGQTDNSGFKHKKFLLLKRAPKQAEAEVRQTLLRKQAGN